MAAVAKQKRCTQSHARQSRGHSRTRPLYSPIPTLGKLQPAPHPTFLQPMPILFPTRVVGYCCKPVGTGQRIYDKANLISRPTIHHDTTLFAAVHMLTCPIKATTRGGCKTYRALLKLVHPLKPLKPVKPVKPVKFVKLCP
jgi:hypothetical protein